MTALVGGESSDFLPLIVGTCFSAVLTNSHLPLLSTIGSVMDGESSGSVSHIGSSGSSVVLTTSFLLLSPQC